MPPARPSRRVSNQYAPGRGFPDLLAAVAEHQQRFYGIELDPQREVLITVGATEALAATLLALVDSPDDEVVVFEPYYDSYAACVALSGARLVPVPLRWPDFQPDLERLASAVTDRTRVILVNDPHNPTGTVFSRRGATTRSVRLAHGPHDAIIVTDEVYEHPGVRRGRTCRSRPFPGGRADPVDLVGRQDVLADRVEDRLGHRPRRPRVGRARGQASYHDLRGWVALPTGDRRRPAPARCLLRLGRVGDGRQGRLLGTGLRAAGFDVSSPAGSYFTVVDARPPRRHRTPTRSAASCPPAQG